MPNVSRPDSPGPEVSRPDEEDLQAGRRVRALVPRRNHARFELPERDPVEILAGQHTTREPDLVPVRIGRMLQSPFAYYRGAAAVMAHDLARDTATGYRVIACGDAHLANFGLYASPERRLVFDLNDFDEAYPGAWEMDVKRLAASLWLNGRANGHPEARCRDAAAASVRSYRTTVHRLYDMSVLERYYYQVEAEALPKMAHQAARKARQSTSERVMEKLTTVTENGIQRIAEQPPLVRRPANPDWDRLSGLFEEYRRTLRTDTALLLSQYSMVDCASRVVGVGSVGTRCFLFMLRGPSGDLLFMQSKEAGRSVLETHGKVTDAPNAVTQQLILHGHGFRVVAAQRILQAQSDPMLGWVRGVKGEDGIVRDHYLRQYRDLKGSLDLAQLSPSAAETYGELCGELLARAHCQSPGSRFLSGYLGNGDSFDVAVTTWAGRYADQTEADHAALEEAVRVGRLEALRDV
ncbi:DUF2252 domain-containing protein [Arthrobacter ginkgonis]|uniref:DUF2252 domain-containing protein n=1 Tax=Arthrobacter ginkgonis TaxID=1630594 RepID=A0ABP7BVF3_9MICC